MIKGIDLELLLVLLVMLSLDQGRLTEDWVRK